MRMLILCTLFALAQSRPQELASEGDFIGPKSKQEDVIGPKGLVGFGNGCRNIRPYADAGKDGITRFRFCWSDPGWAADKRKSEDAARAWERVARISLEFQDNCNNRAAGVLPIYIQDERPYVAWRMDQCKFKAKEMVLNFELRHPNYTGCNESPVVRDGCINYLAMHEMGHAIGFAHEQDHPHSACTDTQEPGIYIAETQYDRDSIMNYCNHVVFVNPRLSPLDIQGAQKVYGQR